MVSVEDERLVEEGAHGDLVERGREVMRGITAQPGQIRRVPAGEGTVSGDVVGPGQWGGSRKAHRAERAEGAGDAGRAEAMGWVMTRSMPRP